MTTSRFGQTRFAQSDALDALRLVLEHASCGWFNTSGILKHSGFKALVKALFRRVTGVEIKLSNRDDHWFLEATEQLFREKGSPVYFQSENSIHWSAWVVKISSSHGALEQEQKAQAPAEPSILELARRATVLNGSGSILLFSLISLLRQGMTISGLPRVMLEDEVILGACKSVRIYRSHTRKIASARMMLAGLGICQCDGKVKCVLPEETLVALLIEIFRKLGLIVPVPESLVSEISSAGFTMPVLEFLLQKCEFAPEDQLRAVRLCLERSLIVGSPAAA
jgi:hypothetical protein